MLNKGRNKSLLNNNGKNEKIVPYFMSLPKRIINIIKKHK